jgi:predicted ATPase
VDAWTYRATNRAIRYGEHDAIAAKGKADPVPVWVAQAPWSIIPEQQRDRLPLVGRDAESDELRRVFERARREPSAQLISVIGEPGIGKTRLVDDLYAHVAEMPELITWRRGRSLAYGEGVAFWALGEMVKAQAGVLESDSAGVARQKLTDTVGMLGLDERDREWVTRHLGPLVGLEAATSGEGSRVEAFAAWRRFLEALAETGPTVLVFEDIHWADEALL